MRFLQTLGVESVVSKKEFESWSTMAKKCQCNEQKSPSCVSSTSVFQDCSWFPSFGHNLALHSHFQLPQPGRSSSRPFLIGWHNWFVKTLKSDWPEEMLLSDWSKKWFLPLFQTQGLPDNPPLKPLAKSQKKISLVSHLKFYTKVSNW